VAYLPKQRFSSASISSARLESPDEYILSILFISLLHAPGSGLH